MSLRLNSAPDLNASGDSRVLIEQARNGDSESFCELCQIFESRLKRQAFLLSPAMAEDLVQETLFAAWKSIARYNYGCQFMTWLCAILLNQFRAQLRKKRPLSFSMFFAADHSPLPEEIDHATLPNFALELSERAAALNAAILKLSAKHREVVYLRFYLDDSLQGIAIALGCSIGTVKSRLYHALEKLRRILQTGTGSPHDPKGEYETLFEA